MYCLLAAMHSGVFLMLGSCLPCVLIHAVLSCTVFGYLELCSVMSQGYQPHAFVCEVRFNGLAGLILFDALVQILLVFLIPLVYVLFFVPYHLCSWNCHNNFLTMVVLLNVNSDAAIFEYYELRSCSTWLMCVLCVLADCNMTHSNMHWCQVLAPRC